MPMPVIDAANRKKPLSYDPKRKKFIYYDDITSGAVKIIVPSTLTKSDQKRLVIERQRVGPDYAVQSISGPRMTRDDVVRAIENDQPFGQETIQADISYLDELLEEMRRNLKR